jgi:Ca-activated chloride channel family protein
MTKRHFLIFILGGMLALTACSSFGLPLSDEKAREQGESGATGGGVNMPAPTMVALQEALPNTAGGEVSGDGTILYNIAPAQPLDVTTTTTTEPVTEGTFEDYGVNPFVDTAQDHLSTFAMDVDTASYTVARSYLTGYGQMPPADAIRVEEILNYYDPRYPAPTDDSSFAIHMAAAPSPFAPDGTYLLRVGIQGQRVNAADRTPATLIFVIDVSGSMDQANRLPLVKETLSLLVNELREDDKVGIVIYADSARLILEPTSASNKDTILNAINSLRNEGSTYAEAGLMLAYNVARNHIDPQRINRVILLSDGVANVGETGPDQILQTIQQGVNDGITLTTVGFGMGDFNDVLMEQLANDGNGSYFYVDTLREARRIFVNNLTSTLQVLGYNAKIQVDFNPETVASYRLLGYENRAVADQDFRNDTVDAGEVGAGHSITALYEITLQPNVTAGTLATTFIRYEHAATRAVIEQSAALEVGAMVAGFDDAPVNFRLQAVYAEFAELLRGSEFAADGSYNALLPIVQPLSSNDPYALELLDLIQRARNLTGK